MSHHLRIAELEGGFNPGPVPPGWEPPQAGLPLVHTIEPESGPWQRASKYGRSVDVAWPATAGEVISVFNADRCAGPPRKRLVHLFRGDQVDSATVSSADVRLRCTYGIGGTQNVFDADWLQGGDFAIVCDTMRVEAVTFAPTIGLYIPPVTRLQLGAFLGQGGGTPPLPPTFTTPKQSVATGAFPTSFVSFTVPDFARRFMVNRLSALDPAPGDMFVLFRNQSTGSIQKLLDLDGTMIRQGTSIPGGTQTIEVYNIGASNPTILSLTFFLGL